MLVLAGSGCGVGGSRRGATPEQRTPTPSTARAAPQAIAVDLFTLAIRGTAGLTFTGTYVLVDEQGRVQVKPLTGTIPAEFSFTARVLIAEVNADSAPLRAGDQEIRLGFEDMKLGFWAVSSKTFAALTSPSVASSPEPAAAAAGTAQTGPFIGPYVVAVGNDCEPALLALLDPPLPQSACAPVATLKLVAYPWVPPHR